MSVPKITDTIFGYKFEWAEELISVDVSRLKQHPDDRLTGEIIITSQAPGTHPHLHQASFNFTSTSMRDKLAKKMSLIFNSLNWDNILEQMSTLTIRKFREGTPVETIYTSSEDIKPPQYLINPLIIQNYPTILYGDPSSGKSTLAQLMIALLTLPWYDNPLNLETLENSTECMVFDYETDRDTVAYQLSCIQRGMGLPEFPFHYRRCILPLADDTDEAMKALDKTNSKVVFIDSIGLATGGELNDAKPALALYMALRKLGKTSVLLAHNSKTMEGKKTPYGSIFFTALARSVWEVKKVQTADEDEMEVGLFHRKPPPFAKLHRPLGFHFRFEGNKTIIRPQDPKSVGEFLEHMETQLRIQELLKGGKLPPADIAEFLGITQPNARMALKRLKDKGKIIKIGERYGLSVTA